jgi:hypothetical protein
MIIVTITFLMLTGLLSMMITDQMTVREAGMLFSHFMSWPWFHTNFIIVTTDNGYDKGIHFLIYSEMAGGVTTIITFCMK